MERNGKGISVSLLAMVMVLSIAVLMSVTPAAAAPPVPSGTYGIYWLEPDSATAPYGNTVTYDVWLNTTVEIFGGEFTIETDPDSECGELVPGSFVENTTVFTQGHAIYTDTKHLLDMGFLRAGYEVVPPGVYHLGNFSVLCNSTGPCGVINLSFNTVYPHSYITNTTGDKPVAGQNSTFQCAGPINVDLRAEGIAGNIFDVSGYTVNPGTVTEDGITINNQTAMGAVVAYCQDNGINVNITMGYYGEWLIQIGNDPADEYNWMYAVNETVPGVSGAQYDLTGGEFVHWYNYKLNYYTVLTTLNRSQINAGDYLNATVTWKNTTGTYPLSGASVNVSNAAYTEGPSVGTTGPDGNCTFQWSTPGMWYVYAVDPVHGSGMYNYPPVSFTCTGVYMTVDAPDECIPHQSQFTVDIKVNPNNLEVYSAQYVLSFNSSVLRAETQVKGPFLTSDGNDSMVVINRVDNTAGETEYSETRKDTTVGVTDPGVLATITFTAIGDTGTSSYLNLSEVIIGDPTAEAMPDAWIVIQNDSIKICQNEPPVADATVYDDYNNVGSKYLCKVYFDASGSNDPDGNITYYRWDFGDGDYGTGMIKEHVYTSWNWDNATGYKPFNASLTVTDDTPEPETGTDTTYFLVNVSIAGDANYDGVVNILDASMIGLEWMHTCNPPSECWRDTVYDERADRADLNNDHVVNILDAVIVGTCWKHTAWGVV